MRLNRELVRNLLFFVEDSAEPLYSAELQPFLDNNQYSETELIYAIEKLEEAGFIHAVVDYENNPGYKYGIFSLTWDGHEFLDNIRDPKIWRKIKETTGKIAGVSMEMMGTVAADLISKVLSGQLDLP